jgi:hypothetical protein
VRFAAVAAAADVVVQREYDRLSSMVFFRFVVVVVVVFVFLFTTPPRHPQSAG